MKGGGARSISLTQASHGLSFRLVVWIWMGEAIILVHRGVVSGWVQTGDASMHQRGWSLNWGWAGGRLVFKLSQRPTLNRGRDVGICKQSYCSQPAQSFHPTRGHGHGQSKKMEFHALPFPRRWESQPWLVGWNASGKPSPRKSQ